MERLATPPATASDSVLDRSRLEKGSELTSTPRSGDEMSDAFKGAVDDASRKLGAVWPYGPRWG